MTNITNNNNITTLVASMCGSPRWPETRICSGKGICEPLDATSIISQCICEDGWSGHGDALNRVGIDCNVHAHSVRVIHWIGLIYGIVLWLYLVISVYRLRHRPVARVTPTATLQTAHQMLLQAAAEAAAAAAKKREQQKQADQADLVYMNNGGGYAMLMQAAAEAKAAAAAKRRAAQQKAEEEAAQRRRDRFKWCTDWDAPQRAVLVAILYAIMEIVYFAIRLTNTNYIIASSSGIAALWMIGSTLFFCFAAAFLWIVVGSVITPLKLNPIHARQVRFLTALMKWSLSAVPTITLVGMFPLIFLSTTNDMDEQEAIVIAALVCMSASCVIILISIRIFGARLIAIIEHSMSLLQRHNTQATNVPSHAVPNKDKRLGAGRARIVILVRAWTALAILGGGSFLATAVWPWLRTQTAYVLPCTWLIAGIAITFGTLIFTRAGSQVAPSAESEHEHYAAHIVENNRRALAGDHNTGGFASARVSVIGMTTGVGTPVEHTHLPTDGTSSPGGHHHTTTGAHPFHSMRSIVGRTATIGWSTACQPLDGVTSPHAATTVASSPAMTSTSVNPIHITSPIVLSSHASHITIAATTLAGTTAAVGMMSETTTTAMVGASSSAAAAPTTPVVTTGSTASIAQQSSSSTTSIIATTTVINPIHTKNGADGGNGSGNSGNDGILVIPASPVHVDIDHMDAPAMEAETISQEQPVAPTTPPSRHTSVYVAVAIQPFPITSADGSAERGVAVTVAMSSES